MIRCGTLLIHLMPHALRRVGLFFRLGSGTFYKQEFDFVGGAAQGCAEPHSFKYRPIEEVSCT